MPVENLSRFFQNPINGVIFQWYPHQVLHCYIRMLGRFYFSKRPEEKQRYLRSLRETLRNGRHGNSCSLDLENSVLQGIFDHYFEKLLLAYWGYARMRNFLLKRVSLVHADLLNRALKEGRGVILTTAHYGAVEFLPGTLSLSGYPVTMVVRFKTWKLKKALEHRAKRVNVQIFDIAEGNIIHKAMHCLSEGRIFVTELDEMKHWKPTAHKMMNFFGRRVPLDRAVELLHKRSGSPVVLGLMERLGDWRYQLVFETASEHLAAPIGLGPDAQLLKQLEHYIYDAPDHWYLWNDLHHLERFQAA